MGKYVFYLVIVLCVFMFALRPLFGAMKGNSGPGAIHVKDVYVKAAAAGAVGAAAIPAVEKAQPALSEALKDKALVGTIIHEWVKENA
jgi:hypothetical protein